jgi:hypothetical protein
MLCDSQVYDYMWFDFKTMFDQIAKKLHIKNRKILYDLKKN